MKVELQAGDFARALSLATAAIRRDRQPAGSPAHLVAAEGSVTIRCTDPLGIGSIATTVSGVVIEAGEAAVAGARLVELVAHFHPAAQVGIAADGSVAKIGCGRSFTRLQVIAADNLPTALAIDQEIGSIEISMADCLRLLEPVAAAGHEDTRYYLNGIFLQSDAGRLDSVGTDGLRLIRTGIAAGEFSTDRSLIVPTIAVIALRRLLAQNKPARILVRKSKRLIEFSAEGFCFVSRLVDAAYPDYQRIIPAPAPNTASCSSAELFSALMRLRAAATVEPHLAALQWEHGAGQLDLFLARQPLDANDRIDAKMKGAAQVAVPVEQLADMLKEFNCEQIVIETADKQPLVLRGDGEKLGLVARAIWNFQTTEVAAVVA